MVRVEIESEIATSNRPARVLVYEDEKLVAVVMTEIQYQKGADGGLYPCIALYKILTGKNAKKLTDKIKRTEGWIN